MILLPVASKIRWMNSLASAASSVPSSSAAFPARHARTRPPPSSVSRAIATLEAKLGAALFNRSTCKLHLTEVGTVFLERTRRVLAELKEARAVATELNARPQGLLRLNVPASFGRLHVMLFLPDFAADYPDIRIDLTLNDDWVDIIESGTDLAIRIGGARGQSADRPQTGAALPRAMRSAVPAFPARPCQNAGRPRTSATSALCAAAA